MQIWNDIRYIVLCKKEKKIVAGWGWIKCPSLFHKDNHFLIICVNSLFIFSYKKAGFSDIHWMNFEHIISTEVLFGHAKGKSMNLNWKVIYYRISDLKMILPNPDFSSNFHSLMFLLISPNLAMNFDFFIRILVHNSVWILAASTRFGLLFCTLLFSPVNVPYGFCRYWKVAQNSLS